MSYIILLIFFLKYSFDPIFAIFSSYFQGPIGRRYIYTNYGWIPK